MEKDNKCINWHSLPCLLYESINGKKAVIFTNIDGDLVACEVPYEEINSEDTFNEMKNIGGFKCLGKTMPIQDEFTLVLSLTERCNAGCKYCFLDAQTRGNVMSIELIHAAIDYIANNYKDRMINIAAFGGEPSVAAESVYEMVRYAKEVIRDNTRIKFSITTNGYFTPEFCEFLINNKFHISLSMDGIPKVQKKQRPSQVTIDVLEDNIRRLAASLCELKIRCTVTQYSVKYMLDTVKYLKKLGVSRVHFEPVTPGGRAEIASKYTLQPKPEIFVEKLFECIEFGAKNAMDIICFPYMNMLMAPVVFCDGNIKNRLVVGATGVLSTCVEVQNKEHVLFSALGIGFYDMQEKKFKLEHEKRRPLCRGCSDLVNNSECLNCAFHFFCAGGCPARNYRGSDSTEIISGYRCRIMKLVMPKILEMYYEATY